MNDKKVAEAAAGFSKTQVANALQLIATGGITELDFAPATFDVMSSDGHTHYLTTADACQCPGAHRNPGCKHQCAARLLIAAKAA